MSFFFCSQDPDAALVAAARRGDHAAFDRLVLRHQDRVLQFVRGRLNASLDAEDVVQEVFVAAWRQLPRFGGSSRFKTWLFGIALNRCAEEARRQRRRPVSLDAEPPAAERMQPAWGWDGPAFSETIPEQDALRHHLGTLSEAEREVVQLYYFAELNLREISELLRVNLSTVKTRFYQAHRRLRASLQTEPEPPARLLAGCVR